jgi:chromosome segregation ATPase
MEKYGPAPDDDYLPAQEDVCGAAVDEHTGEGLTASSDPTQLVLKKQLVDIAKRLKREVEDKDLEIASLREAQGNPDALQKLVEKGQEQIRALRDRLKAQQQKLTEAESCIKHKDSELSSVKGVLMRRAEKSGQSKKQLDDLTSSFMTLCDEKKTLAIERDKLEADLRAMEVELRDLRQSREHDHKSFRDAAELTVKWKMEEVGKQVKELQEELKIKRDECASANTQLLGMQQQLVREQETIDSTNAKLQEARVELQRVREAASNSCNMVQEYKSKCSQLEREAAAAGQRCEELARNAQECKNMLEQASIFHAEKMKAADAAWESRNLILQQEISKQASEHEKLVEDKNVKYALLQAEMEEARGLMEEARTKILSLEDEKTKLSEKLEGSRKRVEELEKDCDRLTEESAAAAQLNKETIEEMQVKFWQRYTCTTC